MKQHIDSEKTFMRPMFGMTLVATVLTISALGQSAPCKQKVFAATAFGGQEFRSAIGNALELVMAPYKDHQGWSLRVSPIGSEDGWTYPVNLPLDGEAQTLGSGWGMKAKERLNGTRVFHFTLNAADFEHYSKLANEALQSPDPNAAGAFIARLKSGTFGTIILTYFQLEMEGSSDTVKTVSFKAKIIVPKSFGPKLVWEPSRCE